MGEMRNAYKILVITRAAKLRNPYKILVGKFAREKTTLGNVGVDGKMDIREIGFEVSTSFIWVRIGSVASSCEDCKEP
jgi:hypothetical protein